MIKITFVEPDGTRRVAQATVGRSLMEAAREAGIRGIVAECGGACACSTCHVHIEEGWSDRLPAAEAHEIDMLEFSWQPDVRSRLSCQVKATSALDGLVVHVPAKQV